MNENKKISQEELIKFKGTLGQYFPSVVQHLNNDRDWGEAITQGLQALNKGSLSQSQLNQILHRCSQAGMSEGFFHYYFIEKPKNHPYPVDLVLKSAPKNLPEGTNKILTLRQFEWGLRRFLYDAMLYWGNFKQAYRDLRTCKLEEIINLFASKCINKERMLSRGEIMQPESIPRDGRYLISEMACKTYASNTSFEETTPLKWAITAFQELKQKSNNVTYKLLKEKTATLATNDNQLALFDLMYENVNDDDKIIQNEDEVRALYTGQYKLFQASHDTALKNTRTYLSICNDLDVYVATSMRYRQDFRYMADVCDQIFNSEKLIKYNIRYFDPTLSATEHHEDKGIVECLMVKTAKVLLYFSQHKESLGKVSEYAMALTLGKPVIVLCPDDEKGTELYDFYKNEHPLMRLVEFQTGIVNGSIITQGTSKVISLLDRIFSNTMEYDLDRKDDTGAYYLLKERLTGSTVRVITDDKLLTETFWNNWHGIY